MNRKTNLLILALICALIPAIAQKQTSGTRLYKRVMIVQGGNKKSTNDDAHFITFNNNGCYVSDSNGYSTGDGLMKFVKNDNNLHCYSGTVDGQVADLFFSSDYSRLNIRKGDVTYVYQREAGKTTTASMRKSSGNSGNQNQGGGVYFIPPAQQPTYDNSSSKPKPTPRTCPGCNGTGIGLNHIKFLGGYDKEYCSECGSVGYKHYHEKHRCRVCNGKGTVDY